MIFPPTDNYLERGGGEGGRRRRKKNAEENQKKERTKEMLYASYTDHITNVEVCIMIHESQSGAVKIS